jgi:hypothetical protein
MILLPPDLAYGIQNGQMALPQFRQGFFYMKIQMNILTYSSWQRTVLRKMTDKVWFLDELLV